MARMNWDRLRRARPLDGAEPQLDPDGGLLWEKKEEGGVPFPFGRRLRPGVFIRRRPAAELAAAAAARQKPPASKRRLEDEVPEY